MGGKDSVGAAGPPLRENQDAKATNRANVAIPMATHDVIACALFCLDTEAVSDAPHSWHARDPGLTSAPQDGQVDTMGAPQ